MESTHVKASAILPAFDRRVVLPPSAAVNAPRFRQRDWQLSAQAREILDLIVLDVPQTPRPEPVGRTSPSRSSWKAASRRTMRRGATK